MIHSPFICTNPYVFNIPLGNDSSEQIIFMKLVYRWTWNCHDKIFIENVVEQIISYDVSNCDWAINWILDIKPLIWIRLIAFKLHMNFTWHIAPVKNLFLFCFSFCLSFIFKIYRLDNITHSLLSYHHMGKFSGWIYDFLRHTHIRVHINRWQKSIDNLEP